MNSPNYNFIFGDITEIGNSVTMVDHCSGVTSTFKVTVKDTNFHYQDRRKSSALLADFVDLATAVYVADRLSKCPDNKQCGTHVVLPVRCPEILGNSRSLILLEDILYWYTGNHWSFEFKKRLRVGRNTESQLCSTQIKNHVEVALWSGGLDSLAGFINRYSVLVNKRFTLFSTGSDKSIIGRQQMLVKEIRAREIGNVGFTQVPIYVEGIDDLPKNSNLRSRGFTFTLLGVVCAYLEGQNALHIYENGIGAINLAFPGGVGLDHSRAVHPLSLFKMENLVSFWLDEPFSLHNPFLFWTKAQICRCLADRDMVDLIFQTITCDSRFRQKDQPTQCGFCSSCLLRRQSMAVLGITDKTEYVATHGQTPQMDVNLHLRAMLHQVTTLREVLASDHPWYNLSKRYPDLAKMVSRLTQNKNEAEMFQEKLLGLYQQHIEEWERVVNKIAPDLINRKVLTIAA